MVPYRCPIVQHLLVVGGTMRLFFVEIGQHDDLSPAPFFTSRVVSSGPKRSLNAICAASSYDLVGKDQDRVALERVTDLLESRLGQVAWTYPDYQAAAKRGAREPRNAAWYFSALSARPTLLQSRVVWE